MGSVLCREQNVGRNAVVKMAGRGPEDMTGKENSRERAFFSRRWATETDGFFHFFGGILVSFAASKYNKG